MSTRLPLIISLLFISLFMQAQPPSIKSFSPSSGPPGTLVTITGSHLDSLTDFAINNVRLNVISSTGTKIVGKILKNTSTGRIVISTKKGSVASSSYFTVPGTPIPPNDCSGSPPPSQNKQ